MDRPISTLSQTRFRLELPSVGFPFRIELSLAPLVAAWEAMAAEPGVAGEVARAVCRGLEGASELREPIADPSVLDRHRDLVGILMSLVFPAASWERDYAAAMVPFHLRAVHATPSFRRLLLDAADVLQGSLNLDADGATHGRLLHAYDKILRAHYGMTLDVDYPLILSARDADSGLERQFRLQFDSRFVDARAVRPVPPLDETTRRQLLQGGTPRERLAELFPPDTFEFSGFIVVRATDVTDQEVLSAIERDLIDKESVVSTERFQELEDKLRTLLRRPALRLGLAAFHDERVFVLNYNCEMEHGCIFADTEHLRMSDFVGSIHERAVQQGRPLVFDDLIDDPRRTTYEDSLLARGVRNILVAPLHYQDKAIGTLELSSPNPGDLGPVSLLKLREVLPLFSMAVRRSLDELESRVQAVIKEKCTAIHPSVEWRFRRAVLDSIEDHEGEEATELEPIVFRDVYPLYAATDIRGSSVQRNLAVQADLGVHLRLALAVVETARGIRPLPILDETAYRIERYAGQVEQALNSGDEVAVLAFIRQDVEPLFEQLADFGPEVRERIGEYRIALDPDLGTVYRQRRDYEESMTLVSDTISAYLDAEEELAQSMFPHYFERLRTDGVDHTIYVGRSLVEDGRFDEMYLRNLRLWQLMVTCGIARRTEAVLPRLTVPLATTHLVLAHHAPLSIRFRFDERRFDVDGAYNVRYEVIKKRIDKALVQGTRERITQPRKLAIVYSQSTEAVEYRSYLEYLRARGYVVGEVEDLALEELQGVQGLRALRIAIDVSTPAGAVGEAAREAGQAQLRA
ncbi:MAG TPA: GAF domain-containing protein [Methylomirabilota bacterium]